MVFVFDFGFGQGGGVEDAPEDRLQAAIDVTLFEESDKSVGDGGFVLEAHRQVGVLPEAENAQSLELASVIVDEAVRKLTEFDVSLYILELTGPLLIAAKMSNRTRQARGG